MVAFCRSVAKVALRLRTIATKDHPCADFPQKKDDEDRPAAILDLDY
jgi:2-methylfumaryl-CoA hydratase